VAGLAALPAEAQIAELKRLLAIGVQAPVANFL
jgi:hypothetical protein